MFEISNTKLPLEYLIKLRVKLSQEMSVEEFCRTLERAIDKTVKSPRGRELNLLDLE